MMSIQLNLDEMLEALGALEPEGAAHWQHDIETIGTKMAARIGELCGCMAGEATSQGVAFAGTCAPFQPLTHGQPIPEALQGLDEGGEPDWIEQAQEIAPAANGEL